MYYNETLVIAFIAFVIDVTRETMCNKLNRKKFDRTVEILEETYNDIQVQFLQEVASSFAEKVKGTALYKMYDVYVSKNMDTDRDQNSFILLKKGHYKDVEEVSESIHILRRLALCHNVALTSIQMYISLYKKGSAVNARA
jgi:hypothetical protein